MEFLNISPIIVKDIEYGPYIYKNGNKTYCIGSRSKDKYFFTSERLLPDCLKLFSLMNGQNTLNEIKQIMSQTCKKEFDTEYVYKICIENNLIENIEYTGKRSRNEFDLIFKTLMSFDISGLLKKAAKISSPIFYAILLFMFFIDLLGGIVLAQGNISIGWESITGNPIIIFFCMMTSTISVVLHEISHAIIANRFGLSTNRLCLTTIAYTALGAYVRVPGIYFLRPEKRVCIWTAGIYMNLFLLALGIIVMKFSSGYINLLALALAFSNLTLIYSSIVPFYLSDGYFIVAIIVKVPNLRRNSVFNLKKVIKEKKITKTGIIYIVYLFISVVFTVYILGITIYFTIVDVRHSWDTGKSIYQILSDYKNFFIIISLSLVGRIVYKRVFENRE